MPVYADPPYWVKGDMLYPEQMSSKDHETLAFLLLDRHNWVLSYDDCPEVRAMYQDCKIIDLSARYCINGKKDNWEHKNELLIVP
jgi:DNA adenine methylase